MTGQPITDQQWLPLRQTILDQVRDWIDLAGQSAEGRQEITDLFAVMNPPLDVRALRDDVDGTADSVNRRMDAVQHRSIAQAVSGLATLASDLTALRHELKTQTKQSRTLLDQLADQAARIVDANTDAVAQILDCVQSNAAMTRGLAASGSLAELVLAERQKFRPLLLAMAQCDEATGRFGDALTHELHHIAAAPAAPDLPWLGAAAVTKHHARWSAAWRDTHAKLAGLADGLRLTMNRVNHQLSSIGIERIDAVGVPVDAHSMEVLDVRELPDQTPGTVVAILRVGYRLGDWVFQPAQVAAARN